MAEVVFFPSVFHRRKNKVAKNLTKCLTTSGTGSEHVGWLAGCVIGTRWTHCADSLENVLDEWHVPPDPTGDGCTSPGNFTDSTAAFAPTRRRRQFWVRASMQRFCELSRSHCSSWASGLVIRASNHLQCALEHPAWPSVWCERSLMCTHV